MQKLSKGSIDADRRIMAKSRACTKILAIEPMADGNCQVHDRTMYNDRQWHSLYVYCWSHKEDFEFEYKQGTSATPKALSESQMKKLGVEIEDDDDIVRKNKRYTRDELMAGGVKIKELRAICVAKDIPDDGSKKDMIDAIIEAQELTEE